MTCPAVALHRRGILWTRTAESAAAAEAWLAAHADSYKLFLAPLQTYHFRAPLMIAAALPPPGAPCEIVLTSINGVHAILRAIAAMPPRLAHQWLACTPWCAVGPGTTAALRSAGVQHITTASPPDVVGLVHMLSSTGHGASLVTVCASNARPELAEGLAAIGRPLTAIIGYSPQATSVDLGRHWPAVGAVPLASAASVERLLDRLPSAAIAEIRSGAVQMVAMGARTAAAIVAAQLPLAGIAEEPTVPSLLAATVAALQAKE